MEVQSRATRGVTATQGPMLRSSVGFLRSSLRAMPPAPSLMPSASSATRPFALAPRSPSLLRTVCAVGLPSRSLSSSVVAQDKPPATRFAIMELGGTQYKVAADDLICVEKLPLNVGDTLVNEEVLLVGERDSTIIGSPLISGATVSATVEEQAYADKVRHTPPKLLAGVRAAKLALEGSVHPCATVPSFAGDRVQEAAAQGLPTVEGLPRAADSPTD